MLHPMKITSMFKRFGDDVALPNEMILPQCVHVST